VHFSVRQLPGIAQFAAGQRDEAVRLASRFAQKHRIDVWFREDGTYRLLESYRSRTSPRISDRRAAAAAPQT
jgi:hypothetical protein